MPEAASFTGSGRPVSDVLRDIIGNVQEIVRSEVRLAKEEIRDEANRAKPAGLLFAVGAVAATFAALFFLLMILYALSIVMPNWAAALIVSLSMAVIAGATISAARKRMKRFQGAPEHILRSLREKVQ